MIEVTYMASKNSTPLVMRIPEGKDPFEICERARTRIFPDVPYEEAKRATEARLTEIRRRREESEGVGPNEAQRAVVGQAAPSEARGRARDLDRPALPDPSRRAEERAEPLPGPGAGGDLLAGVPRLAGDRADRGDDIRVGVGAAPKAVGVRETSRDAYRRAKFSGKLTAQQQRIVDWMRLRVGSATRQEIARGTGLGINCICGRVNELLDPEIGVFRETGKRRCRVTGETANALSLAVST